MPVRGNAVPGGPSVTGTLTVYAAPAESSPTSCRWCEVPAANPSGMRTCAVATPFASARTVAKNTGDDRICTVTGESGWNPDPDTVTELPGDGSGTDTLPAPDPYGSADAGPATTPTATATATPTTNRPTHPMGLHIKPTSPQGSGRTWASWCVRLDRAS